MIVSSFFNGKFIIFSLNLGASSVSTDLRKSPEEKMSTGSDNNNNNPQQTTVSQNIQKSAIFREAAGTPLFFLYKKERFILFEMI